MRVRPTYKLRIVEEQLRRAKKEFVSMLPESIREEFNEKSYIGGGAIYSIYNNKEPKDYDFFLIDEYLAKKLHMIFSLNSNLKYKSGVKIGSFKNLHMVITDNAISIGQFQIITRWVGTPKEVIGQFDFLHNHFYMYRDKIETLTEWNYLDDNELRFNTNRVRDVANCIMRMNKFLNRGFIISNREIASMLLKLNEVGFSEVDLEILKSKNERKLNFGSGD